MLYKNILLIDDDEDDQEIFLSAVNEIADNVNCYALSNAAEALKKLESKTIIPEVIFLDLNMPVMSGQQFLIEIKKNSQLKNIPILIFSTSSHIETIRLMKELGAHDFITKPNKYDKLIDVLKNTLS
ncbi:MAG: response regulator [Bacteroidetes bacterium]|nr:response regulator [Bacteroidota bacterium]